MSMPFVDDRNDRRNEYKSKTVFEIPLEDTRSDLKIVKYPIGFKSTDSFWPLICQKDTDWRPRIYTKRLYPKLTITQIN